MSEQKEKLPDWLANVLEQSRQMNGFLKQLPAVPALDVSWIAPILRDLPKANEWTRLLGQVAEQVREMETPEFKTFNMEFGWLGFMPDAVMWTFYRKHKASGWEAAWKEAETWFDTTEKVEELKTRFRESSLIHPRLHVIERGLQRHLAGDFVSSVSILFPQVEGLIWDIGMKMGLVDSSSPNSVFRLDGRGNVMKGRKGNPVGWGLHDLVSAIWDYPPFVMRFKERVYSDVLRHPLLHGRDVTKYTKRTSVEGILLLWCVAERAIEKGL